MSIFEKDRFEIWNQSQHPYRHTLSEFSFANPALPGVSNVEAAINWILAVLYPNTKPAVATPGDLPLTGNTLNDYRVVQDNGDGKAASYRWEQREGDTSPKWYLVYEMDWGTDSILAAFINQTQDIYVWWEGRDQTDASGAVISGIYAGQTIYGGKSSGSNLTLKANSGDGTGASTGFVQIDDQFRPAQDNKWSLGTSTFRFLDLFLLGTANIGDMAISSGNIFDSSGNISFQDNNLSTTGTVNADIFNASTKFVAGTLSLQAGNITDTSGAITFGSANISSSGTAQFGTTTIQNGLATLIINANSGGKTLFTSSLNAFDFGSGSITTTGTVSFGALTATSADFGNLHLAVNTISSTNTNGNILLSPNGTGIVQANAQFSANSLVVSGTGNISNLLLSGTTLSATTTNANLTLSANGTGKVLLAMSLLPSVDATLTLGSSSFRFTDLYLSNSITDGTSSILLSSLFTLQNANYRDAARTQPAQSGDSLFWDSVSGTWLASHPDTEITHSQLSGLTTGDAGHTQFALLTGRPTGQTLLGGTQAGDNLVFGSTSNATKGAIRFQDTILPDSTATYSSGWLGVDVGGSSNYYRDVYSKGQHFGLRLENLTTSTLPAASTQNIGRLVYTTDVNKIYADTGSSLVAISRLKYIADQSFDGVVTSKTVTVSGSVSDARTATWNLLDNANNYANMMVTITATAASTVVITTNVALPAGSYRLIGVE